MIQWRLSGDLSHLAAPARFIHFTLLEIKRKVEFQNKKSTGRTKGRVSAEVVKG